MDVDPAQILADHVCQTTFADLPEHAIQSSRTDILDTLGAALGGSVAPGIEAQFSLPFLTATALALGRIGIADVARVDNPAVLALVDRMRGEPQADAPAGWGRITIRQSDGPDGFARDPRTRFWITAAPPEPGAIGSKI
jgi:2-methylcitrate dehydratase PrpD